MALTVALLGLDVPGKLLRGDSLAAAVALPKPMPLVTLCQQVLRQAGDLNHLHRRQSRVTAVGRPGQLLWILWHLFNQQCPQSHTS